MSIAITCSEYSAWTDCFKALHEIVPNYTPLQQINDITSRFAKYHGLKGSCYKHLCNAEKKCPVLGIIPSIPKVILGTAEAICGLALQIIGFIGGILTEWAQHPKISHFFFEIFEMGSRSTSLGVGHAAQGMLNILTLGMFHYPLKNKKEAETEVELSDEIEALKRLKTSAEGLGLGLTEVLTATKDSSQVLAQTLNHPIFTASKSLEEKIIHPLNRAEQFFPVIGILPSIAKNIFSVVKLITGLALFVIGFVSSIFSGIFNSSKAQGFSLGMISLGSELTCHSTQQIAYSTLNIATLGIFGYADKKLNLEEKWCIFTGAIPTDNRELDEL